MGAVALHAHAHGPDGFLPARILDYTHVKAHTYICRRLGCMGICEHAQRRLLCALPPSFLHMGMGSSES